ncbi:hypothetical protein MKW92_049756 [Papaver armeniacum]|nr:hypothetical protein MKW92_049756 [Papaver armeniacum]
MKIKISKSDQEIEDLFVLHNFPSRTAQIDETKVADPAAAFEKRFNELRQELVVVRGKLTNLSPQDWKKFFGNVQSVIYNYVYLLSMYPPQFYIVWGDLSVDLNILKELKAKLEFGYDEAEKNYYNLECTHLNALRKRAMMLRQLQLDLDSVNPPAFTLDENEIHCLGQLLEDVNWEAMLEYVDIRKRVLSRDPVKKKWQRGSDYEEKVNKAQTEMDENLAVHVFALSVCKLVKHILSRLEHAKLDDDIKLSLGQSGQPVLKKQKH